MSAENNSSGGATAPKETPSQADAAAKERGAATANKSAFENIMDGLKASRQPGTVPAGEAQR